MFRRQHFQRRPENFLFVAPRQHFPGVAFFGSAFRCQDFFEKRQRVVAAFFTPRQTLGLTTSDNAQPSAKAGGVVQLRKGMKGQQENLLRDVFRRRPTGDERRSGCDDRRPVARNEFIKRFQVANERRDDQLFVRRVSIDDTAHQNRRFVFRLHPSFPSLSG